MIPVPTFVVGGSLKSTPTGWTTTSPAVDPPASFIPDKFDWYITFIAPRTANFKTVLSGNGSAEAPGISTCCEIPR